jgi:hypothetical protein
MTTLGITTTNDRRYPLAATDLFPHLIRCNSDLMQEYFPQKADTIAAVTPKFWRVR